MNDLFYICPINMLKEAVRFENSEYHHLAKINTCLLIYRQISTSTRAAELDVEMKMFDPVQISLMEARIKTMVLQATKPCPELYSHLNSSTKSLDWIAKEGSETMLKLALALDDVFNPNLLSLIFKN